MNVELWSVHLDENGPSVIHFRKNENRMLDVGFWMPAYYCGHDELVLSV